MARPIKRHASLYDMRCGTVAAVPTHILWARTVRTYLQPVHTQRLRVEVVEADRVVLLDRVVEKHVREPEAVLRLLERSRAPQPLRAPAASWP